MSKRCIKMVTIKLKHNFDQSSLLGFELILNISQYGQIEIEKFKLMFINLNGLLYLENIFILYF